MSWEKLMSAKVPEGAVEVVLQVNDETRERRFMFEVKKGDPPKDPPKPAPKDDDWREYDELIPGVL